MGLPNAGAGVPNPPGDAPPKGEGLDCASEPKPLDEPKPPEEPKVEPEGFGAPPNEEGWLKPPELCPKGLGAPIADACPKAGAADGAPKPPGEGAPAEIPNTDGSSWYFFARFRNI